MNKILLVSGLNAIFIFDPETGSANAVRFEGTMDSLLFFGTRLFSNLTLYDLCDERSSLASIHLTDIIQRSSPLGKLLKSHPGRRESSTDPKRVLFHPKVKSSNYGKTREKRKMFQPILATKKVKSVKKLKNQSVREVNYDVPNGAKIVSLKGQFQTIPSVCRPATSGSLILADGDNIVALKSSGDIKPLAAIDSAVSDFSINKEYMAVASVKSLSLWSKRDSTKPRAHCLHQADHLMNISDPLAYCTAYANELSFIRFEPGQKSVLDRFGIGGATTVSNVPFKRFHEITAMCGRPNLSYCVISGSDSSISIFDLAQGGVASDVTYPQLGRCHWSHMIDENTFLLMGLNTGCYLFDIRSLNRIQV